MGPFLPRGGSGDGVDGSEPWGSQMPCPSSHPWQLAEGQLKPRASPCRGHLRPRVTVVWAVGQSPLTLQAFLLMPASHLSGTPHCHLLPSVSKSAAYVRGNRAWRWAGFQEKLGCWQRGLQGPRLSGPEGQAHLSKQLRPTDFSLLSPGFPLQLQISCSHLDLPRCGLVVTGSPASSALCQPHAHQWGLPSDGQAGSLPHWMSPCLLGVQQTSIHLESGTNPSTRSNSILPWALGVLCLLFLTQILSQGRRSSPGHLGAGLLRERRCDSPL